MDRISNLPEAVIECILEKLSLGDQVRTSILSSGWRRRWAKLPSLIIDYPLYYEFFYTKWSKSTTRKKQRSSRKPAPHDWYYVNVVRSILLQCVEHLRELSLFIPSDHQALISGFDLPLHCVLMNGIESLSLSADPDAPCVLPLSFAVGLKHLKLEHCEIYLRPGFHGFPDLVSLSLECMIPDPDLISNLISSAPVVEEVKLFWVSLGNEVLRISFPRLHSLSIGGEFKSISVCSAQTVENFKLYCTATALGMPSVDLNFLCSMTNLKHLTLGLFTCKILARGTNLPRLDKLKTLSFDDVYLDEIDSLKCMLSLITRSSNLKELDIKAFVTVDDDIPERQSLINSYKKHNFDHLFTVNIEGDRISKIGIKLIELLLSCCAVLELISIDFGSRNDPNEMLSFVELVTGFYRRSPKAEVVVTY